MSFSPVPLPTRRATLALGRRLAAAVEPGDALFLEGGLGAGKTFLARAIVRALGVPGTVSVTSPTFALVHEYEELGGRVARVCHADLYRLDQGREVGELGLREARAEGAVVVAEWAERFAGELGPDGLVLRLEGDGPQRVARLTPRGPRGLALAQAAGAP